MQSSSIFIKISGPIPEVKKHQERSMIGEIFLHTGKNPGNENRGQLS